MEIDAIANGGAVEGLWKWFGLCDFGVKLINTKNFTWLVGLCVSIMILRSLVQICCMRMFVLCMLPPNCQEYCWCENMPQWWKSLAFRLC